MTTKGQSIPVTAQTNFRMRKPGVALTKAQLRMRVRKAASSQNPLLAYFGTLSKHLDHENGYIYTCTGRDIEFSFSSSEEEDEFENARRSLSEEDENEDGGHRRDPS